MTGGANDLRATLALLDGDAARLEAGGAALEACYRDCLRAYAPANPAFERERIIAQLTNPRELVYVAGLLSEGENECALLLDLMRTVTAADPHAPVAHIADEAWYYLRTSIDERWQLDDGPPSIAAAIVYLHDILGERLRLLHASPPREALANEADAGRAERLRSLRADFAPSPPKLERAR